MSLDTVYDPDNIFTKIISRDLPSSVLYENDDILSFMDVFPQSDGHCLVVHKRATATNILDIRGEDLHAIIDAVQKIAGAVKNGLNPDGIRIVQFNGAAAGQTVFHLHFHIIPTYNGQRTSPHATGAPVDLQLLEPIAEKIRRAL